MFVRSGFRAILLLLVALLLPTWAAAQNAPPPGAGGNRPPSGFAAYELHNNTRQTLTFDTYDLGFKGNWRTHTIRPGESRRMAWHSGSDVGKLRIATQGRGFVEYNVRAGWGYDMVWDQRKGMWDLRTLQRG